MKKNYTVSILIFSILIAIASAGLLYFFFKVIENKNLHSSVVFTTLQDKIKEKENSVLNASKITELKSLQESINGYFVNPDKIATFVDYLEKIGSDLGSDVSVTSIDAPLKNQNIIIINLSIIGTFEKVMNTINFLENIPYQIDVTQIYLNKNSRDALSVNMKTDAQVKTPKTQTWQADISFNILSSN